MCLHRTFTRWELLASVDNHLAAKGQFVKMKDVRVPNSKQRMARMPMMRRYELTEEQWRQMEHLLPGREGCRGVRAEDNFLFVNAIIWMARTGAPWRDLPDRFGNWNSVFQRFSRWTKQGVWRKVFETIQDPDLECLILDSTTIRAYQPAAGAVKKNGRRAAEPDRFRLVESEVM